MASLVFKSIQQISIEYLLFAMLYSRGWKYNGEYMLANKQKNVQSSIIESVTSQQEHHTVKLFSNIGESEECNRKSL